MKYLYKIGLILSVVLTAGACSGQLDTIQEYLDAGETIYAAKMDSVDIRPGYNRVEVTGLLKYGMDTERCVIHWTPDNDSLVVPVKRIDPVDTFRVFIENLLINLRLLPITKVGIVLFQPQKEVKLMVIGT